MPWYDFSGLQDVKPSGFFNLKTPSSLCDLSIIILLLLFLDNSIPFSSFPTGIFYFLLTLILNFQWSFSLSIPVSSFNLFMFSHIKYLLSKCLPLSLGPRFHHHICYDSLIVHCGHHMMYMIFESDTKCPLVAPCKEQSWWNHKPHCKWHWISLLWGPICSLPIASFLAFQEAVLTCF